MKSKHAVVYNGMGIWRDGKGILWGSSDNGNSDIQPKREFTSEGTEAEFLDTRKDISFMVEYGQMAISTVSIDEPVATSSVQSAPAVTITGKTN
jgi:hypothetical protein